MEVTLTLAGIGHFILVSVAVVLLAILCVAATKMIKTFKELNKVLEDVSVITSTAAAKTQEVDGIITDVTEAVSSVTELLKGNQSSVKALSSLVNSLVALKGLFKKCDE